MIRDGRYCPLPRRNCNGPGVFLAVCRQMSLRARQPFLPKRQTRPVASKTLGSPRCFPLKGISANLYRVAIDEVRSPLTKPPCARSESDYTPGVKIEGQGLRQSPPFPNPTTTYVVAGLEKGAIGNSYPNQFFRSDPEKRCCPLTIALRFLPLRVFLLPYLAAKASGREGG